MHRPIVGLVAALIGGLASPATPAPPASPPFVVALLVDTSGSVGVPELERARRLAESLLDSLPAGSEIAVFRFDDQSRLVLPRTAQREEVRRALAGLTPAGRKTALNDALFDGSKYVREVANGRGALVLITDGLDEDSAVDLDDALRVAEGARIPVYAVGVGKVQEKRLRRIAKLTGGEYLPIGSARGATLARSIAALAAPVEPTDAPPPATPVPGSAPAAAVAKPPTTRPAGAAEPPPRWPWMVLGALVLAGAGLAVVASRRGRDSAPGKGDDSRTLKGVDLSDTVLTKLHPAGEEFLEQTIVLRDRPALNVTRGLGTGRAFELNLDSSTSLGRAHANDIVLEDVAVSSEHCRVRLEDGQYVVHDLKSTNGTFVNDKRVTRHVLEDGDVLQVGETFLTFQREHRRV